MEVRWVPVPPLFGLVVPYPSLFRILVKDDLKINIKK